MPQTEMYSLTCRTCGSDYAGVKRVILADGLETLVEFGGRCGHRWDILATPSDGVITLPQQLKAHLFESYRSLTRDGTEDATTISIELFLGDLVMRLVRQRVIPINEATILYLCGSFLMERYCAEGFPKQYCVQR